MKKRLLLIGIFTVCLTLLYIARSYALFETEAGSENTITIGKWTVLINDEDVTFSESIGLDSFVYDENGNVREGYIAPGVGGSFTIELNASDTDVSMKCIIEMDDEELDDHPNMTVEIDNTTKTNLLNSDKDYEVVINHNDLIKSSLITYSFEWEDLVTYNENDTQLIGSEINVYFNVHCEQYLGE